MAKVDVEKEVVIKGITISLNKEEAQTLANILTHIVGPDEGPRGFSSRLWSQLNEAGFPGYMYPTQPVYANTHDRVFITGY